MNSHNGFVSAQLDPHTEKARVGGLRIGLRRPKSGAAIYIDERGGTLGVEAGEGWTGPATDDVTKPKDVRVERLVLNRHSKKPSHGWRVAR